MKDKILAGLATGAVFFVMAGFANATLYSYDFEIDGNSNVPTFTLTNTGSIDITGYSLTIGDLNYNWDAAYHESGDSVGWTLTTGDTNDGGGTRVDMFEYAFTSFNPGYIFTHQADIDIDSSNTGENYRTVLFNNGSSDNALLTVSFLNAGPLSMALPDGNAPFSFSQSGNTDPVPEPATMLLFGTGLVGLVGSRLRKKKK
jgi:hypothetical protein